MAYKGARLRLKVGDVGQSCFLVSEVGQEKWAFRGPGTHIRALRKHPTTFEYAAPEVIQKESYTLAIDIWSAAGVRPGSGVFQVWLALVQVGFWLGCFGSGLVQVWFRFGKVRLRFGSSLAQEWFRLGYFGSDLV